MSYEHSAGSQSIIFHTIWGEYQASVKFSAITKNLSLYLSKTMLQFCTKNQLLPRKDILLVIYNINELKNLANNTKIRSLSELYGIMIIIYI